MKEAAMYVVWMTLYSVIGGLQISMAIDEFKRKHLIRGGVSIMLAISMVLLMAKLVFTW